MILRCLLIVLLLGTIELFAIQSKCQAAERFYVASDIYSPAEFSSKGDSAKAESLYARARMACEQGEVGTALRLATEALVYDPDHADARRVLGYRKVADSWAGSFAARRIERGEVWHPQFGWIEAEDVEQWEAGKRRLGKRWISEEEDIRRHPTIEKGWQIRTDHFRVLTNHSREQAALLAMRLEMLYQIWQQQFAGFYLTPQDLLKRFEGKESSGYRGKPFQVMYYKTREEYNSALRRQQPQIDMTLGIYFDHTRTTHFFAGKDQDAGTIYHEAVHQFFQESRKAARNVGALSNAWIIEGIACYFESLTEHRDAQRGRYYTLGTPQAGRLPAARHRRLVDNYYVPLAELSTLGMTDLQRRSDIARLYSQSAGLATFLMHYQEGSYRQATVEFLKLIYAGRDKTTSLPTLTGRSFEDLDQQYAEFLKSELPITANSTK